jgi:hypothetical protein
MGKHVARREKLEIRKYPTTLTGTYTVTPHSGGSSVDQQANVIHFLLIKNLNKPYCVISEIIFHLVAVILVKTVSGRT